MLDFQRPKSKRQELLHHASKMRGGKLQPVACVPFLPGESGILSQEFLVEMEPIAGRLISDVIVEATAVAVPILAIDEVVNTDPNTRGNAEHFRRRLEAGEMLFPLEDESAVTKVMGIEPQKVGASLKTLCISRVAHNIAVNFLRKRKYVYAAEVPSTNAAVTPALLSSTALDRFNAVLDPDDHINGSVNLVGEAPVRGLGVLASPFVHTSDASAVDSTGPNTYNPYVRGPVDGLSPAYASTFVMDYDDVNGRPNVRIDFTDAQALSLKDFYRAERQDTITRNFRQIIDANPEYGEQIISRLVHGLQVDTGKTPVVLFNQTIALGASMRSAMDGPSLDTVQTMTAGRISFTRVVPRNEFGWVVVTFLSVKPEEVLSGQPHPVLSNPWIVRNHAADELAVDPVSVTRKELDSACPPQNADDVMFYVGNNHLQRSYQRFDWSRDVDPQTVDHRSARWRYQVPISVSPENIVYPEDIEHYPFMLNSPTDPAASYVVKSVADIASPNKLGPTPVERIDIIDDFNLFEDEE